MFMCPTCKNELPDDISETDQPDCDNCGRQFSKVRGFLSFMPPDKEEEDYGEIGTNTEFLTQEDSTTRDRFRRYFVPLLEKWGVTADSRILCLGCGGGADVLELRENGLNEVYGMDMGWRAIWWESNKRDSRHLFLSDGRTLPFQNDTFDVVISLGVIEHVGAVGDTAELYPDYEDSRAKFIADAVRVLKPTGHFVLACPNRRFPIDFQHNISRLEFLQKVASKTGISIHSPWNPFLLAYTDVRKYLAKSTDEYVVNPLLVSNYLGLSFRNSPMLKPMVSMFNVYLKIVDKMPRFLRMSGVNPYMLAHISSSRRSHN